MFHLIKRFFGFLTAARPGPGDQLFVSQSLTSDLQRLFYSQRVEDQHHAIIVARRVQHRPHLIEAALMHDIGKTEVGIGAIGRSLATLWSLTSLPIWGEWLTYLNHGPIGATLLEAHGAGALAVSFARYHPGPPPLGSTVEDWLILERSDAA